MSKRGAFGKPYRHPPAGWPKALPPYPSVYAHKNPALNGLAKMVNTTSVQLIPGLVGRPLTRPANVDMGGSSCEYADENGMLHQPWIGLDSNSFLTSDLPGMNQFTQRGTNDKGKQCRLQGWKAVQARRSWHGIFPMTCHDGGAINDQICATQVTDANGVAPGDTGYVATYNYTNWESYQGTPSQIRYLKVNYDCAFEHKVQNFGGGSIFEHITGRLTGSVSVDEFSGLITRALTSAGTELVPDSSDPTSTPATKTILNGAGNINYYSGTVYFANGLVAALDAMTGEDFRSVLPKVPFGVMGGVRLDEIAKGYDGVPPAGYVLTPMPPVTDQDNYSGSGSLNYPGVQLQTISLSWSRTSTTLTFSFEGHDNSGGADGTGTFSGTIWLSDANCSDDINSDIDNLLSFWPLTDDNLYPWRTDGFLQLCPLVTRDETGGTVSLLGDPYPVNDLRAPIADAQGRAPFTTANPDAIPPFWTYAPGNKDDYGNSPGDPGYNVAGTNWTSTYTQMPWFDVSAFGFRFLAGRDSTNCAATDFVQFALTGKIFGMPMPLAFMHPDSGLLQPGFTPPAKYDYQNFFDYRATVWEVCLHTSPLDGTQSADWFVKGYGQWLYDVILKTGAQLPHAATQWTDKQTATFIPPYHFRSRGVAGIADMATKYAEIQEIWPSYDFARPAGADKFLYEETLVFYYDGGILNELSLDSSGNEVPLTSDPGVGTGIWGGKSVDGFYTGCSLDITTGVLTLGTKVFNVPSDWASRSDDTTLAFGKLRFPTAPAIWGRMNVVGVADATAARVLTTGALTTLGLDIPQAETVDICAADMTVLASAVIPTRINAWVAATAYTIGQIIIDAAGNLQRCTTAGTSGGSAPTWNTGGTTADGGTLVWTFALAGSFAVDTTFTVPTALGTIATAKFIVSHGATNYEWDDNQRKGDFAVFDWVADRRTSPEVSRGASTTDCGGHTPPTGWPTSSTGGYSGYKSWHQTQFEKSFALAYNPCAPLVLCISNNGEYWGQPHVTVGGVIYAKSSITIPFLDEGYTFHVPGETSDRTTPFHFDDRFGALQNIEIEQAEADRLWQTPHTKCGLDPTDPFASWKMDSGNCTGDYAHFPFVEARVTVPNNGGFGGTDVAPTPPGGIGYGDITVYPPATNLLSPPGPVGWHGSPVDPDFGELKTAFTSFLYRIVIESSSCAPASCAFDYVGAENLGCYTIYSPTTTDNSFTLDGMGGMI